MTHILYFIAPICSDDNYAERIDCYKLLGVLVISDLTWDVHIMYLLNKIAKRFYCIRYLDHACIREYDIITVHCSNTS